MSNYSNSKFSKVNENSSWYKVYNLISNNSVVLDIGCSSGNFGRTLIKEKGCKVDGIELDSEDVKRAKKELRNVWQLDIERDTLPKNLERYDYIYFGDVIEHLVDPINTLKKIKPSLKKRTGKVIFSIPNMGHLMIRLDLLGGKFDYTETGLLDKTHLHFYTQNEVFRVFEEAGYKIDNLDFVKKDYPKELIQKILSEYGLKGSDKFFKAMQKTDASAFQFIGSATVDNIKKSKLKKFGPIDMFEEFHANTVKGFTEEVNALKKSNDELKKQVDMLSHTLTDIKRRPHKLIIRKLKKIKF